MPSLRPASHGAVLHLVGRVTDSVFSFLGPTTATLAHEGYAQTVVLVDDPSYRHVLPKFDESVRLVLTNVGGSQSDRLKTLLEAYRSAARSEKPAFVHLHGVVCSVLGRVASQVDNFSLPTYFTPHGSKSLARRLGTGITLPWFLRPIAGGSAQRVIANSGVDARLIGQVMRNSVDLIESPVPKAFFDPSVRTVTSTPARIVTGSFEPTRLGAALFAQCAVVLSDQRHGLQFEWAGKVPKPESAAQLMAAGVKLVETKDDGARLSHLAGSSIYMAPEGTRGFPVILAEAMALGLPCIAWDTPHHRDMIRHGDTGFLCNSVEQLLSCVGALTESGDLRRTLGAAARREARARFDTNRFTTSLLNAYSILPSTAPSMAH